LLIGWHMKNPQITQLNTFPDKMNAQLNVLSALVMNWV